MTTNLYVVLSSNDNNKETQTKQGNYLSEILTDILQSSFLRFLLQLDRCCSLKGPKIKACNS